MREKMILGLVIGFLLIAINAFAADGDLIVNGSLGVGAAPVYKLTLKDGHSWGTSLGMDATGTTGGRFWSIHSTGGNAGQGQGKFLIQDTTGAADRLTIDDSGRVGIGTTTPTYKLTLKDGHTWGTSLGLDATGTTGGRSWSIHSLGGDVGQLQGKFLIQDNTGGANRLAIDASGNVGIGNTNPTYLLTMEAEGGGFYSSGPDQGWHDSSSIRWKSDVRPIANALDTVLRLNGVSFKRKKRTDIFEDNIDGTQKYVSSTWEEDPEAKDTIGLIGEDVIKVVPEVVAVDQKDSNFVAGVAYSKIVPLLIEAIKEQQRAIEALRAELESMKAN